MQWLIERDEIELNYTDTDRLKQRFALATLWFHTDSDSDFIFCAQQRDATYPPNTHECTWFNNAVECNENDEITSIRIGWDSRNSSLAASPEGYATMRCFVGGLPSSIGFLTNLTELVMNGQDFKRSTIPTSIYNLEHLEVLSLSSSNIAGTISPLISQLFKLKVLDLSRNALSGGIPALGRNADMEDLRLQLNVLTGSIPTSLTVLPRLSFLLLHGNMLNGTIPTEFGRTTSLVEIELQGTLLMGTIPTELAGLPKLTKLHAFNTQLHGTNPLCATGKNYTDMIVDCHVTCPCCSNCCGIENQDQDVCSDGVCLFRHFAPVFQPGLLNTSWGDKGLACACTCGVP